MIRRTGITRPWPALVIVVLVLAGSCCFVESEPAADEAVVKGARRRRRAAAAAPPVTMVPITILRSAVDQGAVCMDGTPPAFHFDPGSGAGNNSWIVNLEGGGWCNNVRACQFRKTSRRGSSDLMEKEIPFAGIMSNSPADNPDFYNWNRANGFYFRGQRIWDATIRHLLSIGMASANQVLLSGCSAGGLAAILHCDEFRAFFPPSTTVKCLADAGLFLDAYVHALSVDVSGGRSLRSYYSDIVAMQSVAPNLPPTCTNQLDATSCFFPQNLIDGIQTPIFLLNAAYDAWQIQESLAPNAADPSGAWRACKFNRSACNASQMKFLQDFRDQMVASVSGFSNSKSNGLFVNSCFAHCQSELPATWNNAPGGSPAIQNKGIAKSVGDWYFDRAEGLAQKTGCCCCAEVSPSPAEADVLGGGAAGGPRRRRAASVMVPITILKSAVDEGAVCMDGTPPAYHLDPGSGAGKNNWIVNLEGGGWCNNARTCRGTKQSGRGSSDHMDKQIPFTGIMSSSPVANPDFYSWNRVKIRYCDGGSFAGDTYDKNTGINFRGQRIWNATIRHLLSIGMASANQVLLTGCSSGGLAVILHCDEFSAFFPPGRGTTVKCLADAGLYLDAVDVSGGRSLRSYFGDIVAMQGIARTLPSACTTRLDATSCFFPQNIIDGIKTPIFLLNAAYDFIQIVLSLAPDRADPSGAWKACKSNRSSCNASQMKFLQDFRDQMVASVKGLSGSNRNGLFIDSCFAHCQSELPGTWNNPAGGSPTIQNKGIARSVGDWYFDRAEVKAIDCRYPCGKNCHNII
ncbi:hypothetical protein EJB05_30737 [Eragrostis curvula]|uniref:Pectin acetylesterase n=1 Tax=Eragrostis curvula TaxID=38414 RepID=A0A5J9UD80_9POAL|nr:hypothetical protein EJB05_30737 [Eragrostis curvula]